MTSFDATTASHEPWPQAPAPSLSEPQMTGLDTLSLLKTSVAERVEIEPLTLTVPGGRIRLVCKPDIPEKDLRRWQRASLPAHLRKSGSASALDQNQLVIAGLVLTFATERIEVRDAHDDELWHTVEKDGEPLDLNSDQVLRLFNAMDPQYLLVTIFRRESDVIQASQKVLAAAGWTGENGGDEEDPR